MTTGSTETFGALLRRHRSAMGWTQEDLAERAGLSTRAISDLEREVKVRPHRDTIDRLVTALGMTNVEREAFVDAARPRSRPARKFTGREPARNHLPSPATALLGRNEEVLALESLIGSPDVRLVTLTGTGGAGKTRLAIDVAHRVQSAFPDGAFFVSLGALTDPSLVGATIAQTLRLRETSDDQLLETLALQQALLVLDNFEHLLDAAGLVAGLVSHAPGLTVLITSRAPLGIAAEREFPVLPLALPEPEMYTPTRRPAAVELFIQRARAVRPDLSLTESDEYAVLEICRRLDGLPLAIELAAARCRLLSPRAISARLERRLPLLTMGGRDAPLRHQTLRDALSWSYDLLSNDVRALFRTLSVFTGGFSLTAVEALAASSGTPSAKYDLLDHLTILSSQSLIGRDQASDEDPRFTMLETVREYGAELLATSGEQLAVEARHAAHYAHLTLAAEPELIGSQQLVWFTRLEHDQANIRLALTWMLRNDIDCAMAMAGALIRFWDHHGHRREGLRWLTAALESEGSSDSPLRGKLQWGRGTLALVEGDYDNATAWLTEGAEAALAAGDLYHAGFSLNTLGTIASDQGDLTRARALHEEGLGLLRQVGDEDGIAALSGNLGYDLMLDGELDAAIERCVESLALYRGLGSSHGCASMLSVLGQATLRAGRLNEAGRYLHEGIRFAEDLGNNIYLIYFMHSLATLAAWESKWDRAARLFGATDAHMERISYEMTPFPRSIGDAAREQLRTQLDPRVLGDLTREGYALIAVEAVNLALEND